MLLTASSLSFLTCVTVVDALYCNPMNKYFHDFAVKEQQGSNKPKNITLYWDSDLTRAAAAVLSVTFHHGLGYQFVQLQQTPRDGSTAEASSDDEKLLEKIELTLFTNVTTRDEHKCDAKNVTPSKLKLHVHIANHVRHNDTTECVDMTELGSYSDVARLKDCGFGNTTTSASQIIDVYNLTPGYNMTAMAVKKMLNTASIQLQYKELNRNNLFQMIREGNESFLFIDYDMWDKDEDVSVVKLHPCLETDTNISNRIAKETLVKELARSIFDATNSFTPSLQSLKEILELESSFKNIEEAACKWAIDEAYETVEILLEKITPNEISVFICSEDKELKNDTNLNNMILVLGHFIKREYFNIKLKTYFIDCTYPESIAKDLQNFVKHVKSFTYHIGCVIGGVKNIEDRNVVKVLNKVNLPVLMHDAISIDSNSMNSVWMTNGRILHLALTLKHFIVNKKTTYVTVLTELSLKAKKFNADLTKIGGLILTTYEVHDHIMTLEEAENVLQKIKDKTSSVVLVNTNNDDAATILTAAVRLNMNDDNKITWIVREWSDRDMKLNLKFLTFSFWYENGKDALNNNWHDMEVLWKGQKWPSKAMATADAVLTLVIGIKDVFNKFPQARDDLEPTKIIHTQFEKSLIELSPLRTAHQNLTYKGHSPEEALVYLNEWYSGQRTLLARYRVNATAQSVRLDWKRPVRHHTHRDHQAGGGNAFRQRYNELLIATMFLLVVRGNL